VQGRVANSAEYLADHMGEAPVLVLACNEGRDRASAAAGLSNVIPGTWSFMLAARARGLGTCWTTIHLMHEREAADVLGIPYDEIMQVALTPVAYTIGTEFKPAPREPLASFVHWEAW
jgi:nitroreductase